MPGHILIKAMAMHQGWHMALALMLFLCCVSSLAESMRDYTSLCSSGMDVSNSAAWAPKFLIHPYAYCLILLSNTVGLSWVCGTWLGPGIRVNNLLVRCVRD